MDNLNNETITNNNETSIQEQHIGVASDYDTYAIEDFCDEACGKNEKGQPKATLYVCYMEADITAPLEDGTLNYEAKQELNLSTPYIDISTTRDFRHNLELLSLNITFDKKNIEGLRVLWKIIEKYYEMWTENNKSNSIPALSIMIFPTCRLDNPIFIEMSMPIVGNVVSLTPNQLPQTINLLFDIEDCGITNGGDVFNKDEVIAETNDEIAKAMEEEASNTRRQEEENQKLEQLRAFNENLEKLQDGEHKIRVGRDKNN